MQKRGPLLLVTLITCVSSEQLPDAKFDELCGTAAPVRVLELTSGERLTARPKYINERIVFRIGTIREPSEYVVSPKFDDVALWSAGPCGESPIKLDLSLNEVTTVERWDGLVLGHRLQERDIVALDIKTGQIENRVFAGVGSSALYWTEFGLVTFQAVDESTGTALLHEYPDDPHGNAVTGRILLDSVHVQNSDGVTRAFDFKLLDDSIIALTPEHELVFSSLRDQGIQTEQTDVKAFAVSPDGRYLLWQVLNDDASGKDASSLIALRDRSTGTQVSLGDGHLDVTPDPFGHYESGLFVVNRDPFLDGRQRVYSVANLSFFDLPDDRILFHVFPDGAWGIGSTVGDGIDRYDPLEGTSVALTRRGIARWWGDDEVEVLDISMPWSVDTYIDDGPLYRIRIDGQAHQLAAQASRVSERDDESGRWFSGVELNDELLGLFILIDPQRDTATKIDSDVFAHSAGAFKAFGQNVLAYSVDDGDKRSGVWLVRIK